MSFEDFEEDGPALRGSTKIEIDIPLPDAQMVAESMAQAALRSGSYDTRPEGALRRMAEERLRSLIDEAVTTKAAGVIEEIMARPLQRTDSYGQPVGEPVSLAAVIADRVENWATERVDQDGKLEGKNNRFGAVFSTRLEHMVRDLASGDLKRAVDKEVTAIRDQLKAGASAAIAKQIASRVAETVLK